MKYTADSKRCRIQYTVASIADPHIVTEVPYMTH